MGFTGAAVFQPELVAGASFHAEMIGVGLRMSLGIYSLEISAVWEGDHHSPVFQLI